MMFLIEKNLEFYFSLNMMFWLIVVKSLKQLIYSVCEEFFLMIICEEFEQNTKF